MGDPSRFSVEAIEHDKNRLQPYDEPGKLKRRARLPNNRNPHHQQSQQLRRYRYTYRLSNAYDSEHNQRLAQPRERLHRLGWVGDVDTNSSGVPVSARFQLLGGQAQRNKRKRNQYPTHNSPDHQAASRFQSLRQPAKIRSSNRLPRTRTN